MNLPTCEADWAPSYFGGCGSPARYRIERPGDSYPPMNVCPTHLADAIAYIVDGDDVEVACRVYFDAPALRAALAPAVDEGEPQA